MSVPSRSNATHEDERRTDVVVFYLNLARRKDRRDRFLAANATIARFHRWEAIDGSTLHVDELVRRGLLAEPLEAYTRGALGCALSHKGLWDHCAAGNTAITVCEDDAIFNRHFARRAETVLAALPNNWDIILWGWNFDAILHVDLIPGMKQAVMQFDAAALADRSCEFQEKAYEILPMRLVTAFGTICYSLSPHGARSLGERCFPLRNEFIPIAGMGRQLMNFGIDTIMNKHYSALQSYVSFPPLVWTDNDKSTSDVGSPDPSQRRIE